MSFVRWVESQSSLANSRLEFTPAVWSAHTTGSTTTAAAAPYQLWVLSTVIVSDQWTGGR